jgi:hypothetical protein
MKIKDIVAMMAVMVTAGGCTSNDEGTQPGEVVPIRLAATITPANTRGTAVSTRAAGDWGERTTTQDTELLEGQTVRAWVSENDGSHTAAIKNPIEYTVSNATGDLEPVSDTTPFYYPVGVNTISIHAIHPSGYDSGEKFTVNLDQTTEANYAASDLCYSQPADFTRSDVDANGRKLLQMKHLLSKIVVNLTLDENVTGATLPQAIKLHAMTSTVMTYPVDVATAANGYTGCTVSDASDLGAITMKQEAIIPPQTIAAGVSFITFNVDGLGPMLYPLPAATTFESGKRYTYNIRITDLEIQVTNDITDWVDGTESDGNGFQDSYRLMSQATASDIGKVICSNGHIHTNVPAVSCVGGVASGIISYVGNDTGESGYTHGLAIAIKDANGGNDTDQKWTTGTYLNSVQNGSGNQQSSPSIALSLKESGLTYSTMSGRNNATNFPAFYHALLNDTETAGTAGATPPSGSTQWFLPSVFQWNQIIKGLSGRTEDLSYSNNQNYTSLALNPIIALAGGGEFQSSSYWSSSEIDKDHAWALFLGNGTIGFGGKNYDRFVRACFAF